MRLLVRCVLWSRLHQWASAATFQPSTLPLFIMGHVLNMKIWIHGEPRELLALSAYAWFISAMSPPKHQHYFCFPKMHQKFAVEIIIVIALISLLSQWARLFWTSWWAGSCGIYSRDSLYCVHALREQGWKRNGSKGAHTVVVKTDTIHTCGVHDYCRTFWGVFSCLSLIATLWDLDG